MSCIAWASASWRSFTRVNSGRTAGRLMKEERTAVAISAPPDDISQSSICFATADGLSSEWLPPSSSCCKASSASVGLQRDLKRLIVLRAARRSSSGVAQGEQITMLPLGVNGCPRSERSASAPCASEDRTAVSKAESAVSRCLCSVCMCCICKPENVSARHTGG
jgi:hypothetical protein